MVCPFSDQTASDVRPSGTPDSGVSGWACVGPGTVGEHLGGIDRATESCGCEQLLVWCKKGRKRVKIDPKSVKNYVERPPNWTYDRTHRCLRVELSYVRFGTKRLLTCAQPARPARVCLDRRMLDLGR